MIHVCRLYDLDDDVSVKRNSFHVCDRTRRFSKVEGVGQVVLVRGEGGPRRGWRRYLGARGSQGRSRECVRVCGSVWEGIGTGSKRREFESAPSFFVKNPFLKSKNRYFVHASTALFLQVTCRH
jgi:hypothetical protein